jgi:hypothetical protein
MIWKIWKKGKKNSGKIWKIWKKSKLNSDMIWKIWKKSKLNYFIFPYLKKNKNKNKKMKKKNRCKKQKKKKKKKKKKERGHGVLHNISENTRKKGGNPPTSGCACAHPWEPPSGSRD